MYVIFDQKSMIVEHEIAHQSPGSKPVILTGLGRFYLVDKSLGFPFCFHLTLAIALLKVS